MSLGVSMRQVGYHYASWRHPSVPPGAINDFAFYANNAQIAERAKFDFLFFADGDGMRPFDQPAGAWDRTHRETIDIDPIVLLSALSSVTSRIGLAATASTTYNEPFHIARKFASLDLMSRGRAGWNVVTSWSDQIAQNFGRDAHVGYADRYAWAQEFVDVVYGLWDSWESDAIRWDKESGIFFDRERLHTLNHKGSRYSVRGPLPCARCPQGRPVIFQAGASEPGLDLAARTADAVFAVQHEVGEARAFYASLKGRMPRFGRSADEIKVLPGITPIVGLTKDDVKAKLEELDALVDPLLAEMAVYNTVGDIGGAGLDEPVPTPKSTVRESRSRMIMDMARRENLTVRQLGLILARSSSKTLVGTVTEIADTLEEWFSTRAADGFVICPAHNPVSLLEFTELVVPELRRRDLFKSEYQGTTLRHHLGLAEPANRYELARHAVPA